MPPEDLGSERHNKSLTKQIKRSQRQVAVMFTDVEGSTSYWDSKGDIKGRLMVDLHNRLVVPQINRHHGKVVKFIGDAIMAYFKTPKHALRAAIAIQQKIKSHNLEGGKDSMPKVRIGIHYGKALVEPEDIFGDMVNVASRVEDHAKGGQICVSGTVASKVGWKAFKLVRCGSIIPRGTTKAVKMFRCDWLRFEDMTGGSGAEETVLLSRRQKIMLLIHGVCTLIGVALVSYMYLRFLVAQSETLALWSLWLPSPWLGVPALLTFLLGCAMAVWFWLRHSLLQMRLLKGGFWFSIFLVGALLVASYLPAGLTEKIPRWNHFLFRSSRPLVDVLANGTGVYRRANPYTYLLKTVNFGDLLYFDDTAERRGRLWNHVQVSADDWGWIPRTIPPKMGVPERDTSRPARLEFTYKDLYILTLAMLGMIWGLLRFRLRPI